MNTNLPQQPFKRRVRSSPDNTSSSESIDIQKDFNPNSSSESISSKELDHNSYPNTILNEGSMSSSPLDDLEKQLNQNPEKFRASLTDTVLKKTDKLSKQTANKIITTSAQQNNVDFGLSILGITALTKGGGSNASMPPISRMVNGHKFELKTLRDVIKLYTNNKGTVRQFTKTMRDTIYKVSVLNEWPRSLFTALQKDSPDQNFSKRDLVTACEFNEDNFEKYMPAHVQEALVDRAQKSKQLEWTPKKKNKKGSKS
jgi:hypothetical protein